MNTFHVYAIINEQTLDAYVGCSIHLKRRTWRHLAALNKGEHPSQRLQDAWNRYGSEAFQVSVLLVLEDVPEKSARRAEAFWIDKIGTYNERGADPETGKAVWSQAMRATMAQHTKRRWADPEQAKELAKGRKPFTKDTAPRMTAEMLATHGAHMRAIWADPVRSAKLKARLSARWKDPLARERQAEKMRAFHAARRAGSA